MQQEQDTESPGQPHGGAICAQQGAQSPGSEAAKQGVWAKSGWPWSWGSLGIPLWAHICWKEGQPYLLWREHQEESKS